MRRIILISLFLLVNTQALAMTVFDPNVYLQVSKQLLQSEQQLRLLKQQLDALKQLNGSQYKWSDAKPILQQLQGTLEQSGGLAYTSTKLNQDFKDHFPGYETPKDYSKQYQDNVKTSLNTLQGVMLASQQQNQNMLVEEQNLKAAQAQVQNAVGPTQAVQAASQITSAQITQLQLLRQAILTQTQAQSVYYSQQLQKEAAIDAKITKTIQAGQTKPKPFAAFTHLEVPTA